MYLPAGWINESRVQFADDDQRINSLDASCRGSCTNLGEGGPTLEVAGIASVGRHRFTPLIRMNRRIQLADTISYVRRAHHVKLGVDYNNIFFPTDNRLPAQFGGRFSLHRNSCAWRDVGPRCLAGRDPRRLRTGVRESLLSGRAVSRRVGLRAGRMESQPADPPGRRSLSAAVLAGHNVYRLRRRGWDVQLSDADRSEQPGSACRPVV